MYSRLSVTLLSKKQKYTNRLTVNTNHYAVCKYLWRNNIVSNSNIYGLYVPYRLYRETHYYAFSMLARKAKGITHYALCCIGQSLVISSQAILESLLQSLWKLMYSTAAMQTFSCSVLVLSFPAGRSLPTFPTNPSFIVLQNSSSLSTGESTEH